MADEKNNFADEQHIFCLVVGAGMGGCTLGSQFIRQNALSRNEFRIIDRGDDYGGVWQANQYPGAVNLSQYTLCHNEHVLIRVLRLAMYHHMRMWFVSISSRVCTLLG